MRYIVNADDLGRTETVNQAIFESFERNLITNATVMVNMPFFDQATKIAFERGLIPRIGLHINLISGSPLTDAIKECPSFTNSDGRFNGKVFRKKHLMFFISPKEKAAVRDEVKAQIERYFEAGYTLKHADSHGHIHTFPSLQGVIFDVLRECGIESVRISRDIGIRKDPIVLLYKKLVNRRFVKNKLSTDHFGALGDVIKAKLSRESREVTEVMIHPNYINGKWTIGEMYEDEVLISETQERIDRLSYINEKNDEKK